MIVIKNIIVSPFVDGISKKHTYLRLSWELESNNDDLSLWELTVHRSESPAGNFEQVSVPFFNETSYIDYNIPSFSKNRVMYYKLVGHHVDTGERVENGPVRLDGKIDLIGLEIIRRNNLLLKTFNGVPVGIFVKKTSGKKCGSCYDFVTSRVTSDSCTDCYGTGYEGGFEPQISTYANFNPEPKLLEMSGLIAGENGDTTLWMSNYPELEEGDVICESTNKRWRVMRIEATRKFRVICHQIANVRRINPSDVEYRIPFSDPDVIISQEDAAKRREHTVVALSRYQPDRNVSMVV